MHACNGLSLEMGTIGIANNFAISLCMPIIGLKDCNKSMITISSQLYKIKFGMMEKLIHQVYWKKQAGCPKKKQLKKQSNFLDPGHSPIICSPCGKVDTTRGHVQRLLCEKKHNSHEMVLSKNRMFDQWVTWYYKILYYGMVRNKK